MNNVSIKKNTKINNLNRRIELKNGSLVVLKCHEEVLETYIVVPFRDHKNEHQGCSASGYCHFVNLDSGKVVSKHRYERRTTEKNIIEALLTDECLSDCNIGNIAVSVYLNGNYRVEVELLQEVI